jgi:hypothetical protein
MNIKDLKEIIKDLPDDMEVIQMVYSDFHHLEKKEFTLVKAVATSNGWLMRSHPTMSDSTKKAEKTYLLIGTM